MSTLVLGHEPVVEAWLQHRRLLGQDGRDEVWGGVHLVAPRGHGRNGAVASELQAVLRTAVRAAGPRAERGTSALLGLRTAEVQSGVDRV